jgi:hypothetical protein
MSAQVLRSFVIPVVIQGVHDYIDIRLLDSVILGPSPNAPCNRFFDEGFRKDEVSTKLSLISEALGLVLVRREVIFSNLIVS